MTDRPAAKDTSAGELAVALASPPAPVWNTATTDGAATGREAPTGMDSGVPDVLAQRVGAALLRHNPGWQVPRPSVLARRHGVNVARIKEVIDQLVEDNLIRRLPDGQLVRASPADHTISLAGIPGLAAHVDPMGVSLFRDTCQVSYRKLPEEVSDVLGMTHGEPGHVIRTTWTTHDQPACVHTTYLAARGSAALGGRLTPDPASIAQDFLLAPLTDGQREDDAPSYRLRALSLEFRQPPPWVAHNLRLPVGKPAILVTVRFDDTEHDLPVALTIAILKADLFRVVLESHTAPLPPSGNQQSPAWSHVIADPA